MGAGGIPSSWCSGRCWPRVRQAGRRMWRSISSRTAIVSFARPARRDTTVHEAKATIGKVPAEDVNGVPSTEDRFQVKLGGTTMTWDGHLAGDSVSASRPVEIRWAASGERGAVVTGALTWRAKYSRAMAGSLTIDGNKALAKALRESPTRFAGPAYRGGGGDVVAGALKPFRRSVQACRRVHVEDVHNPPICIIARELCRMVSGSTAAQMVSANLFSLSG